MAKDIQNPRTGNLLTDHFGLVSRVRVGLEEFVTPVAIVADLGAGAVPPICRSCTAQFSLQIVAMERPVWQFVCPTGIIARITSFWVISSDLLTDIFIHFGNSFAVVPGTPIIPVFTDQRLAATPVQQPSCTLRADTQIPALAGQEWRRLLVAGGEVEYHPKNWLIGGTPNVQGTLEFAGSVVANGVNVTMEWDEFIT